MTAFFAKILGSIYEFVGNYGLTIIIFTVLFRIIMLPLSISQKKNMLKMKEIQPEVNEINKKYKNDNQKRSQATMDLYKQKGYNPFAGCLPSLIQIPIIFTLFNLFRTAGEYLPKQALQESFLWMPSMNAPDTLANILPSIDFATKIPGILPIVAAFFTYLTFKRTQPKPTNDPSQPQGPNMGFMGVLFPAMILFFGSTYAAGLILYWATSTVVQFVQDIIIEKMLEGGLS